MKDEYLDKEYLTIKEFADLVDITVDSLRHYDRKGLFRPTRHGIEFENGYRYYTAPQIITVKLVRVLTEIGVPLDTIREMADSRTPEKVLKLLTSNHDKVAEEIRFRQDVLSVISTFIELIHEGTSITETEITVKEMPERRIILGDENHFDDPGIFMGEFIRFYKSMHIPNINTSFPIGAYWPDIETFLHSPVSPARFFSLDPKGNERQSAGLYLKGYTRGYYGCINDLPDRMKAFAEKNGLLFTGEVYGIYLHDEISIVEPNEYLMEVAVGVTRTRRSPSRKPINRYT